MKKCAFAILDLLMYIIWRVSSIKTTDCSCGNILERSLARLVASFVLHENGLTLQEIKSGPTNKHFHALLS
jgi:hypothetical protein